MFFKNVLVYKLTESNDWSQLEEALKTKQAKPCASSEMYSYGFIAPYGKGDNAPLAHVSQNFILIAARKEERVLPASAVNKEVQKKVDEIETRDNRKVYKKERYQIKDDVISDLLPRTLTREKVTYAAIVPSKGLVYVDTTSSSKAEDLLSLLRKALGTLKIRPLAVKVNPELIMTDWLRNSKEVQDFTILNDCELHDSCVTARAIIRCKRLDLNSEDITNHVKSGKIVTQLALSWQDKLTFLLDGKLSIKRIKFEDILLEQANHDGGDDAASQFSASFVLMMMTFNKMLSSLVEAFGGEDEGISIDKPSSIFDQFKFYDEAVTIVKASGNAGTSHLQRQLKIGYNHASILIERMERESIVSAQNSMTGKRTVLL